MFQEAEALINGAVNFVITGAGVVDGFGVGVLVGAGADILKVRD